MLNPKELAQGLIAVETPHPPKTTRENAQGFAKAYSEFLYKGSVNGAPMTYASLKGPGPQKLLLNSLVAAFTAKDPASISLGMQAATLAFLNAGPVATLWPTATGITVLTPLATFLVPTFTTPTGNRVAAKTLLAGQIHLWLTTGVQVTFPSPPPYFFV